MSFSFNNPLEIGDRNKAIKNDIAEIKQDIGNLDNLDTADKSSLVNALNEALDSTLNGVNNDLTNLSDAGEDKLRSLNAYSNEGELLTDADGLVFVKKYAHSTFDESKFTVVGTPKITNDGIASGFSSSNYINIPNTYAVTSTSNIEFNISISKTSNPSASSPFMRVAKNDYRGTFGFLLGITAAGYLYTSGIIERSHAQLDNNRLYNIKLKCVEGVTSVYLDGDLLYSGTYTTDVPTGYITIGAGTGGDYFQNGSFDLKQFSIIVDGVEVFSGNKTGIDTIKPTNYAVVGTATVSADGVASGFSNSSYVTSGDFHISELLNHSWSFISPIISGVTSSDVGFRTYLCNVGSGDDGCLRLDGQSKDVIFTINTPDDTTPAVRTNHRIFISKNIGITPEKFQLRLDFDLQTGTYYGYYNLFNGNGWQLAGSITPATTNKQLYDIVYNNNIPVAFDRRDNNTANQNVLDLNYCKIYIDGDLAYQPCLKIPYTESKTGSKVVNAIYRGRVNDMAEQFGYAPYYTLLENTNFTLPQVELYGLIGQKTLRYSYENGINKVELYSNRDLTQQGSCTSGVEVTFMRPFADTNYILTVPYSAKSATAFTPTQTGDWKAEGKGWL